MAFAAFAGLLAPVITSLVQKSGLPGRVQYLIFISVVGVLTAIGYFAQLYPGGWEWVAGILSSIIAIGQGVYALFEPQFKKLRASSL